MKVINATNKYQYIYENGNVVKKELSKEKGIITSFIHPKDVLSIIKKFNKNLSEDEMFLEMEKYIYSYPGVDINKEYKSIFIPIKRDNNVIIEAILIETDRLLENFEDVLNIYKYIDFISPSFLAWEEYYNITKIESKNDIFIYFDENEAFLCGYNEGKYLFHKSLNRIQTLSKLLNKDINETLNVLINKGLDVSKYEDTNEFNIIDKFFNEFFLKVFNIINFSINEYQIAKFDRIIFYSPFEIKGLFAQYENYWALNGIEFKKSILSTEYNHLEYLITIFNAKNYTNDNINLTIFHRPPPFLTTKTGKFVLFLILCIFSIISYVMYEYIVISNQQKEVKILRNKYLKLQKLHDLELKTVKKYEKEDKFLVKEIDNLNKKIGSISNKINKLYTISKEPLFYNILAEIAKGMRKYSLKANKIVKKDKNITIIIVSNYDNTKEVTSFMNELIKDGFKNVKTSFISNKKNYYVSKVSFRYE